MTDISVTLDRKKRRLKFAVLFFFEIQLIISAVSNVVGSKPQQICTIKAACVGLSDFCDHHLKPIANMDSTVDAF